MASKIKPIALAGVNNTKLNDVDVFESSSFRTLNALITSKIKYKPIPKLAKGIPNTLAYDEERTSEHPDPAAQVSVELLCIN